MNPYSARNALKQYQQLDVQGGVEDADPHRLIQLLLEGALSRVAKAKGHMERGEIVPKCEYIAKVIDILDGLLMSLDREAGGELAENLESLYEYMQWRLTEANLHNDTACLDEVMFLLGEIKEAWDAIPEDVRRDYARDPEGARRAAG